MHRLRTPADSAWRRHCSLGPEELTCQEGPAEGAVCLPRPCLQWMQAVRQGACAAWWGGRTMDPPEGVPRPLPSAQAAPVSGMLGRLQGAQSLIFSVHFHPVAALFSLALSCPPVLSFLSAIKFWRLQRNVLECSFTRASLSHFTDAAMCHHLVLPPAHLLSWTHVAAGAQSGNEEVTRLHPLPGPRVPASLPAANLAQRPSWLCRA